RDHWRADCVGDRDRLCRASGVSVGASQGRATATRGITRGGRLKRTVAATFFAAVVAVSMPAGAQTSTPVATNNGTPPSAPSVPLAAPAPGVTLPGSQVTAPSAPPVQQLP